ncbi:MAG: hypothetical protein J6X07_10420 [Prevotella sp.]|nr:hypothetical protein [Prevotella sp.]
MVHQGRGEGGQETDLPAELVGPGEDDQRQGGEDDTALRDEVEQLRQHQVAGHEHRRPEIGLCLVIIQCVKSCCCFHNDALFRN